MTSAYAGRRAPQQERSRSTYEQVLRAAGLEFEELGLAGATTTGIAARAGISVGALYRFFADKHAIADALVDRYLEQMQAGFGPRLDAVTERGQVRGTVTGLVDAAAALAADHPGYYRISDESNPAEPESPAYVVRETLVSMFSVALARAGLPNTPEQRRVVDISIETVRHAITVLPTDPAERAARVVELRSMIGAYVAERWDLPPD